MQQKFAGMQVFCLKMIGLEDSALWWFGAEPTGCRASLTADCMEETETHSISVLSGSAALNLSVQAWVTSVQTRCCCYIDTTAANTSLFALACWFSRGNRINEYVVRRRWTRCSARSSGCPRPSCYKYCVGFTLSFYQSASSLLTYISCHISIARCLSILHLWCDGELLPVLNSACRDILGRRSFLAVGVRPRGCYIVCYLITQGYTHMGSVRPCESPGTAMPARVTTLGNTFHRPSVSVWILADMWLCTVYSGNLGLKAFLNTTVDRLIKPGNILYNCCEQL